jgi:hypothetical protein
LFGGADSTFPGRDLEHAIESGDIKMAIAAAKDLAAHVKQPIPLGMALKLLPLMAGNDKAYPAWACRFLARWLTESREPSIETVAELAAALADLPAEPLRLAAIERLIA